MITRRTAAGGLAAGGLWSMARAATPDEGLTGAWTGVLVFGQARLRLRLVLEAGGGATLFSLDQSPNPITGVALSVRADQIELEFPPVAGRFAGKLAAGDRMEGRWRQGGAELPLTLMRGDAGLPKNAPPPIVLPPAGALDGPRLEALRLATGSPAVGAAAQRRGGETSVWASGHRRTDAEGMVGPEDRWHLGSITKSMTATLVGRMVEAGQLSWDDTVGGRLGEAAPEMRAEYRAVTLRHLACHRSGLPGNIPLDRFGRFSRRLDDPREERLAYARLALAMPPRGPAGATYEYANNGFVVIGAIVERVTGRSWEAVIRERLFAPLKLGSAGFGPPDESDSGQPSGHADLDGRLRPLPGSGPIADNPVALGPAGRVHMSLRDLVAYLAAHRDQSPLLSAETWRTLHTPPFGGDYAMGWMVRPDGSRWHNGSNTLWYAVAGFHPEKGQAFSAATNDGRAPIVGSMLERAAQDAVLALG